MKIYETKETTVTVDLTDTKSIHEYYMYLVKLEREGTPVVSDIMTETDYQGKSSITMKIEAHRPIKNTYPYKGTPGIYIKSNESNPLTVLSNNLKRFKF